MVCEGFLFNFICREIVEKNEVLSKKIEENKEEMIRLKDEVETNCSLQQ